MQVDIWFDVMCPFCYLGKRRFETALENMSFRHQVQVVYHSFQLNPEMPKNPASDIHTFLSEQKGMDREQVLAFHRQLTDQARDIGLEYNMDEAVPANSFDAHRLLQFATERGKNNRMTERLLRAYFTESKNIADIDTLVGIAGDVGLVEEETRELLELDAYTPSVQKDLQEASYIGIDGVPFYVFDETYTLSGAQPAETFEQVLQQVWDEKQKA